MTKIRMLGLGLAVAAGLVALVSAVGGSSTDAKLEATTGALSDSAEECLLSVRDHGTKYDATPACNALGALSMKYVQATHADLSGAPLKYRLAFSEAQHTAWMALAMSSSCSGRGLAIW